VPVVGSNLTVRQSSLWGLDAEVVILLCKKVIVAKSKEVKIGCNLAESYKEGYGSERAVLPTTMMMYESYN
jgi:hypothetical protein